MECQVPGGIPRVFPFVRHRNHVCIQHVKPFCVAHVLLGGFEQRVAVVFNQPLFQIEIVKLLAPQHPRQRLAVHPALIFTERGRGDQIVEIVGVFNTLFKYRIEVFEGLLDWGSREPQADRLASPARHFKRVMGGGFCPSSGQGSLPRSVRRSGMYGMNP